MSHWRDLIEVPLLPGETSEVVPLCRFCGNAVVPGQPRHDWCARVVARSRVFAAANSGQQRRNEKNRFLREQQKINPGKDPV